MDQEFLVSIFSQLKPLLAQNSPPFTPKFDMDSKYDLWSTKPTEIAGIQKDELYFAGLIIQSNYVGFYYMPVYMDKDIKREIGKNLIKTLKGKSCFHIKEITPELLEEVKHALHIGKALYKKRGYI